MKRIVADPQRCLACRTCELACALAHSAAADITEAMLTPGAAPRIYIEAAGRLAIPLQCRHCEDAPCVRVCPASALVRPDQAGPVQVQEGRCIGCGFCMEACPFGVIRVLRRKQADASVHALAVVKCDLCQQRQAAGLQPACVASCPVKALSWGEVRDVPKKMRAVTAAAIADGNLL